MDNIKGSSGYTPRSEDGSSPDETMERELRSLMEKVGGLTTEDFERLSTLSEKALEKEFNPEILRIVDKITDLTETPSNTMDSLRGSPFRPITPFEKVQNVYQKVSSLDDLHKFCEELKQLESSPSSKVESSSSIGKKEEMESLFSSMEVKAIGVKGKYKESLTNPQDILRSFQKHCLKVNDFCFILNIDGEDIPFQGGKVGGPGTGGYGRVFFGVDSRGQRLAVKVVQTTTVSTKEDLEREGRFMLQMKDSEYVVGALHVGFIDEIQDSVTESFESASASSIDSLMFVVMKKVDGCELFEKLEDEERRYIRFARHNNLLKSTSTIEQIKIFYPKNERNIFYPMSEKFRTLIDVARGLEELHNAGIVHRDIKSENVMVLSNGQAKVIDLGLSRYADEKFRVKSGTPCCMSPETINKEEQGIESDIYSFGLLMDELISGKARADGDELADEIFERSVGDCKHRSSRYKFFIPEEKDQDLREQISNLVNQCLKFKPCERIQTEHLIYELQLLQEIIKERTL